MKIDLDRLPEFGRDKNCQYRGVPAQCGPRGLPGEGDLLFHNDGHGRFTEVGAKAGVSDPKGYFGLGIAWFDANDDGWLDLYVADDSSPSLLYLNQKDGTFKEAAFSLGVAVSEDGAEQGGMGVAVGDYDGSGRLSLYKTNFADEYNNLYQNEGGAFTDVAFPSRTAQSSVPYVGWGTAFLDYDNDGWLDLIAVNGHVYPQLDKAPGGGSVGYRQRKLLYRNRGDRTFDEVGDAVRAPAHRGARQPGPGGGRPRQRRAPRRRDQRPRRQPAAPPQRASGHGPLADGEAHGQEPRTPMRSGRW